MYLNSPFYPCATLEACLGIAGKVVGASGGKITWQKRPDGADNQGQSHPCLEKCWTWLWVNLWQITSRSQGLPSTIILTGSPHLENHLIIEEIESQGFKYLTSGHPTRKWVRVILCSDKDPLWPYSSEENQLLFLIRHWSLISVLPLDLLFQFQEESCRAHFWKIPYPQYCVTCSTFSKTPELNS